MARRPYVDSDHQILGKFQPRSILGNSFLNIDTCRRSKDVGILKRPGDIQASEKGLPRKRTVVGDVISVESGNSNRESSLPPQFQSSLNSSSQILQDNQGGPPPSQSEIGQYPSILEVYNEVRLPEIRFKSQEQLVAEVKGIYAGLVMVEAKCLEVDEKQATLASAQPKLNDEQWQALIALHSTLLREHHDFFLASQHPSASPALRRLATKYAKPARMWRHGIHSKLCGYYLYLQTSFDLTY